jgi:uncharacterized protein (TIRG00374 family)
LVAALFFASLDNKSSNFLIMTTTFVVAGIMFVVLFGGYFVGSEIKMRSFARWLSSGINALVRKVTFGRVKRATKPDRMEHFFLDFHTDFLALKRDKKLLIKPTWWSLTFNVVDVSLFFIAFWSLGIAVNPAVMLIAYGAASLASIVVLTPGGAGAYEVIMASILVAGGVAKDGAAAGVILTRMIVLLVTIAAGWFAYFGAMKKYGKPKLNTKVVQDKQEKNDEK